MPESIYHIFVDRFSTGGPERDARLAGNCEIDYMGGNINGIAEKLEYIRDLGFTGIYTSPIFKGNAFHGYHVTDYYAVDPHFGDIDDLENLIRAVHRRKMKVYLDFVPNHVHVTHPFFQDAKSNPHSKYRDWFVWKKIPYKVGSALASKQVRGVGDKN